MSEEIANVFVTARQADMGPAYGSDPARYFRGTCQECGEAVVGCRHCLATAAKQAGIPVSRYECFRCAAKDAGVPENIRDLIKTAMGQRPAAPMEMPRSMN